MNVFIASSFAYCDPKVAKERKKTIEEVESILRKRGYDVFVPHKQIIENAWDMSNREWALKVASMDKENLLKSDVVVLLTYGKERNNSGVSFESGFIDGANLLRREKGLTPIRLVLVKMNDEIESLMMWSAADVAIRGIEGLKDIDFFEDRILDDVELS